VKEWGSRSLLHVLAALLPVEQEADWGLATLRRREQSFAPAGKGTTHDWIDPWRKVVYCHDHERTGQWSTAAECGGDVISQGALFDASCFVIGLPIKNRCFVKDGSISDRPAAAMKVRLMEGYEMCE
jgi:hypothetical protein